MKGGELTPTGLHQARGLGRWFRRRLVPLCALKDAEAADVEMFASAVSRVERSAAAFAEGTGLPVQQGTLPADWGPDSVFRAWAVDTTYLEAAAAVRRDETVAQEAAARAEAIDAVYAALAPAPCTQENAPTVPDEVALATRTQRMDHATYAYEVLMVEQYGGADAWRMATDAGVGGVGDAAPPELDPRCARQAAWSRVSRQLFAEVAGMAHFMWNRRFFARATEWGPVIGGRLVQLVADRLHCATLSPDAAVTTKSRPGRKVSVYAVHDYSMLALLCALGATSYPCPTLGFCASLTVLVFRLPPHRAAKDDEPFFRFPGSDLGVKVVVNPTPFHDPTTHSLTPCQDHGALDISHALNLDRLAPR